MERSFLAQSNLSQNHKTITIISLILCIIVSTQGYTLEGQWQLNNQYLSYTKQNPNVTLRFVNKIPQIGLFMEQDVLEGPKVGHTFIGTKRLTVYACKTLLYNYYVNESSLYLQPVSISNNNRDCLLNQIEQITAKLNQTYYFNIAANKLILYYPSSNTSLTLTRYNPYNLNLEKGMYEQWNFVKLNSEQTLSSSQKEVYFGQNTIDSCGFAASFKYFQSQRNNLKTDMQYNSCDNSAITNTFDQTFFYLQNDRRMTLYDDKLNQLAQLEFVKLIDQSELNSKKNIVRNVNTPKKNHEQNKTNSIDTNKPNNLETNNNESHVQNQTSTTDKPSANDTTVKSENSSTITTTNSQQSSSNITQATPKQDSSSGSYSATVNQTPSNTVNYATPSTINSGNSSNPKNQQNSVTPNTSSASNTIQNSSSTNIQNGNSPSTNTKNSENSTATTNLGTVPTDHTVNTSRNTSKNAQSVPNNSNSLVNNSQIQNSPIQAPVNILNNSSSSRPPSVPPSIQALLQLRNQTASSRLKISTDRQLPDCHCTPIRTQDELYPFDPKLLQNKWYLYSINGTDYNMSAYYYYFLIITPTRMIYYGGCDVKWSDYKLYGNTLSGIFTRKATKDTCLNPNEDENVLLPFFNEVKYINHQIKENVAYINFYGQKYNHISTFTTVAPIYPSNWP